VVRFAAVAEFVTSHFTSWDIPAPKKLRQSSDISILLDLRTKPCLCYSFALQHTGGT